MFLEDKVGEYRGQRTQGSVDRWLGRFNAA